MKGTIVTTTPTRVRNKTFYLFLSYFVFQPCKAGLYGFAAFFTVLIFTKGVTVLLGFVKNFSIDVNDVTFSLLGFVLVFLIRILENIKERNKAKLS